VNFHSNYVFILIRFVAMANRHSRETATRGSAGRRLANARRQSLGRVQVAVVSARSSITFASEPGLITDLTVSCGGGQVNNRKISTHTVYSKSSHLLCQISIIWFVSICLFVMLFASNKLIGQCAVIKLRPLFCRVKSSDTHICGFNFSTFSLRSYSS